jgi:hypothetical protein
MEGGAHGGGNKWGPALCCWQQCRGGIRHLLVVNVASGAERLTNAAMASGKLKRHMTSKSADYFKRLFGSQNRVKVLLSRVTVSEKAQETN